MLWIYSQIWVIIYSLYIFPVCVRLSHTIKLEIDFFFTEAYSNHFAKNITLHANDLIKTLSQVAFWKLFEYSFILALRERNKDLPHWISKTRKMETLSWPTRWSRRGETSLSRAFRSLPQRNHPVSNLPWPAVTVCLLFDWFSFDHIYYITFDTFYMSCHSRPLGRLNT